MATKNYLDYTGLTTYDGLIKDYIGDNTGDSKNVTWEEYSQLPESEKKNSNIAYYITGVPDEESKKGYLGTASGELCTFPDGSDLPMPKLEVAIEPVQDLHGYDAPWVGGAGKNKCNPNINEWNNLTYKYIKLPNFNDDNYIMSFVDKDTSVDLAGINFGFMHNYPDESTQFRWVIINGEIQSDKTNISQVDRTTKCDTLIIYPNTQSAFERIFARYNVQVEKGTTATAYAPYSNICPISGWDEVNVGVNGVNVWDEEWEQGVISITTGQNVSGNGIRSKNYSSCKPNTSYYFSVGQSADYIMWYDKDKNFINHTYADSSKVVTSPSNAYYFKIRIDSISTYSNNVSMNYPSTDTSYHAYNGQTYTIDLDGTRYGGKVDLVSGVMTVTHGIKVYSGNSSEGWYADGTQAGSTYRMKATDVPNNIKLPPSNTDAMSAISNQFIATSADNIFIGNEGVGIPANGGYLTVYDSVYNTNDVSLWKTHLASNPLQIVYELATPLTIQLTPTMVKSLRGVNNVTTDVGGLIQLEYWRSGNVQLRMNDYVIAGGNTVAYADVAKYAETAGNIIKHYGTCDTADSTAAKVAIIDGFDTLETGVTVHIKFANANTASSPTLAIKPSVSGTATTAKSIYRYGTTAPGTTADASWQAGAVISFTYDGTNWMMNDYSIAVMQTPITSDSNYEILFSGTADNSTRAEGVGKHSKLLYNPSKYALTIGSRNSGSIIGTGSFASGNNVKAVSDYSHAEGYYTEAAGDCSHAEGSSTHASGYYSHAEGSSTRAILTAAHAEGSSTQADGNCSHAEGSGAIASGDYSHAEGNNTVASDDSAHAEGYTTLASGPVSHAEGSRTVASGNISHAEGAGTIAQRAHNHVFGKYNVADTGGSSTTGSGTYIEIVGNGTSELARSNARTLDWSGNETLAGNLVLDGSNSDITLSGSGNTWDGTNTSLKAAIAAASGGGSISDFTPPTTQAAGVHGLVPAPAILEDADNKLFLLSDGTWEFKGHYEDTQMKEENVPLNFYIDGNGDSVVVETWKPQYKVVEADLDAGGISYDLLSNDNYQTQRGLTPNEYISEFTNKNIHLEVESGDAYAINKYHIPTGENSVSMDIDAGDINLSSTWDGTNTSLKDAIAALSNRITALGG